MKFFADWLILMPRVMYDSIATELNGLTKLNKEVKNV